MDSLAVQIWKSQHYILREENYEMLGWIITIMIGVALLKMIITDKHED